MSRRAALCARRPSRVVAFPLALLLAVGLLLGLPVRAAADGPTTFRNTSAIAIPAAGSAEQTGPASPYPSTIAVSGMAGAVTTVTVTFANLTHPTVNDVDAMVVAPSGENLVVLSDVGDPDSLAFANNASLSFSDGAGAVPIGNIPTGTYRPTNNGAGDPFPATAPTPSNQTTLAGAFTGIEPNGTWSLYVVDDATGDIGSMANGWSLTITTEVDAVTTTTTVTSSDANSTTGQPVTFTATVRAGGSPVTDGTVQFADGSTNLGGPVELNSSGTAAFTTSSLTEGSHLIRATYSGAPGFLTSNGTVSQRVDNATIVTGDTFCNDGSITGTQVGAATPYPSNIFVTGLSGQITKVTASLRGLTHSAPIDYDILLSGPAPAQNLFLLSDAGGQNPVGNLNLTFDDAAAGPVPTPAVSGTFRPTRAADDSTESLPNPAPPLSAATALSTFNGSSPNGTWSLWVVDDATGDIGSIADGWCLTITAQEATETALTANPNPSTFGQSVTFTASVTADGDPVNEGSVQFRDGATNLGAPVPVDDAGNASLTTSALTVGSRPITAAYGGTTDLAESSDDVVQVVNRATSATALTSSQNPSDVGDLVTFTATVTAGANPLTTGTVQFAVDGTDAGAPMPLTAAGQATFTTNALTAGTHAITATFGGSTNYAASTGELDQAVNKIATETALASSARPSSFGQSVTFTATVTSGGSPVAGGSVQFSDDGSPLGAAVPVAADGTATFVTDDLTVGTHPITAEFTGTDALATSTDSLDQVVGQASSTTTITSDPSSSTFGSPVTLTATVASGGAPVTGGTVQFSVDGTPLEDPEPVTAGTASVTTSELTAGTHTITATFSGTTEVAGSEDDLEQVVDEAASTTVLSSSLNPSTVGDSVTFTATVTGGGNPLTAGTVQFAIGGADTGAPAPLGAAGQATLATDALTVGTHTVTATYGGSANYGSSDDDLEQAVNKIATATTLESDVNPSSFGQEVTFTASVTADGDPVDEGSVQFRDGTTDLGAPVPVDGDGIATLSTSALTVGDHPITATYGGATHLAESSDDLTQVVTRGDSATALTSSQNPSTAGQSVTFTARVTAGGSPVAGGSVQFSDDGTALGPTVPLAVDGTATFTTTDLTVDTHPIRAEFTGTDELAASSADLNQVVGQLIADAGGPYEINEGDGLTLEGSGSSPTGTYDWDIDDDGVFGDVTGVSPELSWEDLESFGIDDGEAAATEYPVALLITSGAVTRTATSTITVTNTAPTSVVTGNLTATVGLPFTIKVGADDPSSADMAKQFTYTVDWGDGSPILTVDGPADPPVTHLYTAAGSYDASFTATDKDGGTGPETQVVVVVRPVQIATPTPTPSPTPTYPHDYDDDGNGGSGYPGSALASTGSTVGIAPLLGAVLLLGGGTALMIVGQRRSGRRHPRP